MNQESITKDQIKKALKKWDEFWGYKPSKTIAILDPEFHVMTLAGAVPRIETAKEKIFSRIRYMPEVSDCENISMWCLSELKMQWAQDGIASLEPAWFRIVIDGKPLHSIVMAFLREGIHFIEFQTGEIWSIKDYRPKILAVT